MKGNKKMKNNIIKIDKLDMLFYKIVSIIKNDIQIHNIDVPNPNLKNVVINVIANDIMIFAIENDLLEEDANTIFELYHKY